MSAKAGQREEEVNKIFVNFLFFKRIVVGRVSAGLYLPGYLAYITVIAYGTDSFIAF